MQLARAAIGTLLFGMVNATAVAPKFWGVHHIDNPPRSFESDDGVFQLRSWPTHHRGSGASDVVLVRRDTAHPAGETGIWVGRIPWTFDQAMIGSDGIVTGVAYRRGPSGAGVAEADEGLIVTIDREGVVRSCLQFERSGTSGCYSNPTWIVEGLRTDAAEEFLELLVRKSDGFRFEVTHSVISIRRRTGELISEMSVPSEQAKLRQEQFHRRGAAPGASELLSPVVASPGKILGEATLEPGAAVADWTRVCTDLRPAGGGEILFVQEDRLTGEPKIRRRHRDGKMESLAIEQGGLNFSRNIPRPLAANQERLLVAWCSPSEQLPGSVIEYDQYSKPVRRLRLPLESDVVGAAYTSNGSLVALVRSHGDLGSSMRLLRIESDEFAMGEWLGSIAEEGATGVEVSITTSAICTNSRGECVLLDMKARHLEFVDGEGRFVRRIRLSTILPEQTSGEVTLSADRSDRLWISITGERPILVGLDQDGSNAQVLTPRDRDGRALRNPVICDGDGRHWTTDGASLCKLHGSGVLDMRIGRSNAAGKLGELIGAAFDRSGRLHALLGPAASVASYDSPGVNQALTSALPGDFPMRLMYYHNLVPSPQGSILISRGAAENSSRPEFVEFDGRGKRVGRVSFTEEVPGSELHLRPNDASRWWVGNRSISLHRDDGSVVSARKVGVGGTWLSSTLSAAVGPAGELAVVESTWAHPEEADSGASGRIHFFSSEARPLGAVSIREYPAYRQGAAFDGDSAFFIAYQDASMQGTQSLMRVSLSGKPARRIELPDVEGGYLGVLLPPGRAEAWVYSYGAAFLRIALE